VQTRLKHIQVDLDDLDLFLAAVCPTNASLEWKSYCTAA
jgi:hypothetical protein